VASLGARQGYLDGELCGGITSFGMIQPASDAGNASRLVYFIFDLLHLDGEDLRLRPLMERKARLAALLSGAAPPMDYSDYYRGRGPAFHEQACKLGSKASSRNAPMRRIHPTIAAFGSRSMPLPRRICRHWLDRFWRPAALSRRVAAGLSRVRRRLVYADRVGSRIDTAELERLWRRLQPLAIDKMPLDVLPPRDHRFGSPLVLSRVHWVRPELVAEVRFLTWREDKPAAEVRRPMPHPAPAAANRAGTRS
jgi:bifunctional non-homologous end joining protein LigD